MYKTACFVLVVFFTLLTCGIVSADSDAASDDRKRTYKLEDISVTPGLFSISERTSSQYFIPKAEMENLPLIDNDIYRAAHNLPGVVANDFSARFALRGGDRDETIIRLDGMELYDPYHLQDFGGAISVIDMGIVQKADLFAGGFPAEYGDAMSGVFDITSREASAGKIGGNVGLDLLNTHFILEGPLSGASWLLAARRGYIDLLMGLIESEETFKPSYYDIYSKVSYGLGSDDSISAHVLYAGDSNEIDEIGVENDLNSRYWNGMLWAKWQHILNEEAFWNLYVFSGFAGREKYENVDGVDERDLSHTGFKADIAYNPVPSQTLKAGWNWQWRNADYSYFLREDDEETAVKADPSGWILNGYAQDEFQISHRFAGNLGLRYIYDDYGNYSSIMPRLALAGKLRDDLMLRGAWGKYYQPVQITNLPVEEGISESQPPEKSDHYVLSAEYTPANNVLLRTEAYYKTFDDLVGRIKDYGRKETFFIAPESGSAKGLEVFLSLHEVPLPGLSRKLSALSLGYALSKSEVETEAGRIPRDFDRRHSLNISADYAFWKDASFNVVWRYHTGDPYTEANYEKVISEDGDSYDWQKIYGEVNGSRYPAYHSLDVRVTKNFRFKRWELSLYLQILNLYNHKNVHEYSFEELTDDAGNTYYSRKTEGLLPLLPTIGLRARF